MVSQCVVGAGVADSNQTPTFMLRIFSYTTNPIANTTKYQICSGIGTASFFLIVYLLQLCLKRFKSQLEV